MGIFPVPASGPSFLWTVLAPPPLPCPNFQLVCLERQVWHDPIPPMVFLEFSCFSKPSLDLSWAGQLHVSVHIPSLLPIDVSGPAGHLQHRFWRLKNSFPDAGQLKDPEGFPSSNKGSGACDSVYSCSLAQGSRWLLTQASMHLQL